jgi:D-arabinose 1-dehydrogenase-like Zn-dependent alcohol dehydrogenase
MCAGVTTFNSLRNAGAGPGQLVAVLGLGGLGHQGVQFAAKMGFQTVGVARGKDKEPLAKQLGAHHYIDTLTQDVAAELTKRGGAAVVLATVTNAQAMSSAVGGLGIGGKLVVLGAAHEPIEVATMALIGGTSLDCRVAVGKLDRFAGHAVVQRAHGCAIHERDLAVETGCGGVRTDDEWEGEV